MRSVVDATRELLTNESGDPSMKAIAQRAGVGMSSLYDYFTHRDGVLDALVDRLDEEATGRFLSVLDERHGEELDAVFARILDEVFAQYLDNGPLIRAAIRVAARHQRLDSAVARRDAIARRIAELIVVAHPTLAFETAETSTRAIADMVVCAALAELHRRPDGERRSRLKAVLARVIDGELRYLRRLASTAADERR